MFRHCILCFPILCYSFFPIYWAYLYVLYSCFRFYQDSPPPFSANPASERCLGWIIIKQPNNSSESLCPNDAIEIKLSDLFVTHAESVCVCVCVGVLSRSDTQNVLFLSDILLISFWPDTGELLFFFFNLRLNTVVHRNDKQKHLGSDYRCSCRLFQLAPSFAYHMK